MASFWFASIVSLVVGVVVLVATEFLIPLDPSAPNRAKQQHFWAAVLSLVSAVLTLNLSLVSEVIREVGAVRQDVDVKLRQASEETTTRFKWVHGAFSSLPGIFQRMPVGEQTSEMGEKLRDLFWLVHESLSGNPDPLVLQWLEGEVDDLLDDFDEGYTPISHGRERAWLLDFSERAIELGATGRLPFVLATELGEGETDDWYATRLQQLSAAGIPLIRFSVRRTSDDAESLAAVQEIHEGLEALWTAVVACASCPLAVCEAGQARELLILGEIDHDVVLVEEKLSDKWEGLGPRGGLRVSWEENNLAKARDDLKAALNCSGETVFVSTEITERFEEYTTRYGIRASGGAELARTLARVLVEREP